MTFPTFWSQVAQCQRQAALYKQLQAEANPFLHKFNWKFRVFFWVMAPLAALIPFGGMAILGVMIILCSAIHSPLKLNSFEALRVPSRQALYTARLLSVLPRLGWISLAMALYVGLWSKMVWQGDPALATTHLLIAALTPFTLLPLMSFSVLLPGQSTRAQICLLGVVIALLFVCPFSVVFEGTIETLETSLLRLAAGGLIAIALQAGQFWAAGRLEPFRQMQMPLGDLPLIVQAGKKDRFLTPTQGVRAPWLLQNRKGVFWAALYRHVSWLRQTVGGMWPLFVIVVGGTVLVSFIPTPEQPAESGPKAWLISSVLNGLPWFGLLMGSALRLDFPEQLYLFGVDYRAQLRHRLKSFWISYALVLVTFVTIVLGVRSGQWSGPLSLLGETFALLLFREGWLEWPSPLVWGRFSKAIWLTVLVILLGVVLNVSIVAEFLHLPWDGPGRMWLFASLTGGIGLAGWLWKWVRLDEASLVKMLRH